MPPAVTSAPLPLTGPVLVTGTDTGVGKTIVTAALAAAAMAAGLRVAVIKPGQTGTTTDEPSDVDTVRHLASPTLTLTLASYPDPLAPLAAARVARLEPLDFDHVTEQVKAVSGEHDLTLIEGAGGLLVPMGLAADGRVWTVADLAATLSCPAVVVCRAALGTLNHTALTLEALEARGIPGHLVIGSWPVEPELVHLTNLDDLPPLEGLLPEGAGGIEPGVFRRSAPGWFTAKLNGTCDDPRDLL